MSQGRRVLVVFVVGAVIATVIAVWWRRDRGPTSQGSTASERGSATSGRGQAGARVDNAIDVHVISEAAQPIADAIVVVRSPSIEPRVVRTDTAGRAELTNLEPGMWTVTASAPGHVSREAEVAIGARREHVELRLIAGGTVLRGTITDEKGGPVGGARIDATRPTRGVALASDATASTIADESGRYELMVEVAGYQIEVSHAAYAPVGRRVDVPAAGATADFALLPGGVIEGRVVGVIGSDAEPVEGARIIAQGGTEEGRVSITGPDGRFRIAGLPPATITFEAEAPGWLLSDPVSVPLAVGEEVNAIELRLRHVARVSGTVVTEAGTPVPAVNVSLLGARYTVADEVTTDEKGAFELPAVRPGAYQLISGPLGWRTGATQLEVRDADVSGVRVVRATSPKIVGTVIPAQLAEVWLEPTQGGPPFIAGLPITTAADGTFELSPPVVGLMRVAARSLTGTEGTATVTVVQPERARVEITLRPGAEIAGRVVDEKNDPVPGVAIMALPVNSARITTIVRGSVVDGRQVPANSDGTFRIQGLHAGRYELRVLERGRALARPDGTPAAFDVEATDGQHVERTLQVAAPRGTIRGVVQRADGTLVADAWVRAVQTPWQVFEQIHDGALRPNGGNNSDAFSFDDRDGSEIAMASPVLTDESGRFQLTNLRPLELTLVVEADRGALRGRIRARPDADVTITVGAPASLAGTVTLDGAPVSAFEVELEGPTSTVRTFSDPKGAFSFARLESGTYGIEARTERGSVEQRGVKLTPGAPTELALTLVAYARITGKLADESGQPVPRVALNPNRILDNGGSTMALRGAIPISGPDGTFEMMVLPGKIRVYASSMGMSAGSPEVEVAAGASVNVGVLTLKAAP